jgi:AcrR family transcriptional regulator
MTRHLSEAERRAQSLRAARSLFVEKGFLGTRVDDVARRARLSKGAVYFYFKSKRELLDALVEEEQEMTLSFLDNAAKDPRPALVKLIELGTSYLDYFAGLKTPPRFFLLMTEMAIRDEQIRERVMAVHQLFVERLSALIAEGTAAELGARSIRRPSRSCSRRWWTVLLDNPPSACDLTWAGSPRTGSGLSWRGWHALSHPETPHER